MAIPCLADTDCIHLEQDGSGALSASPIISPDITNGLSCTPSGLYAPGVPPLVTTLPATPSDGDEVYYLADDTNGVTWHLRYRASSASAYKWELVGGSDLFVKVDTEETRSAGAGAFGALTTPVEITLPPNVVGDYDITHGARIGAITDSEQAVQTVKVGAAAAVSSDGCESRSQRRVSASTSIRKTGVAAASVLALQYSSPNNDSVFAERWMRARPIRLAAV